MTAISNLIQTLTDLMLVSLFTWAVVEAVHHGSLFAEVRAYTDARGGKLKELLGCPFCLSHWVAAIGTVEVAIAFGHLNVAYLILVWFGSVRLSNVLNDLTGSFKRLSGDHEFNIDDEESHGRQDSESMGGTGQVPDDSEADATDDTTQDPVPPA